MITATATIAAAIVHAIGIIAPMCIKILFLRGIFGSFRRVFSGIVFLSASPRGFRFISRFGRLLFNSLRIRFRRITRFDAVRRFAAPT